MDSRQDPHVLINGALQYITNACKRLRTLHRLYQILHSSTHCTKHVTTFFSWRSHHFRHLTRPIGKFHTSQCHYVFLPGHVAIIFAHLIKINPSNVLSLRTARVACNERLDLEPRRSLPTFPTNRSSCIDVWKHPNHYYCFFIVIFSVCIITVIVLLLFCYYYFILLILLL